MVSAGKTARGVEKVLIAEDGLAQAEQLRLILEDNDYAVRVASNGREALAAAIADPPDIVISDINMPEMDGYELCRTLKADATLQSIPVILVTSMSSAQDVMRGLECGADNFITKPYDEDSLLKRVRHLLINSAFREPAQVRAGIEIYVEGKRHFVTAERQQILDLLISTYASAVRLGEDAARRGEQLRESYETMAVLHRSAENLNRLRSEPDIVREVLERLGDLHFVRAGWIWLTDENGMTRATDAVGLSDDDAAALRSSADCPCRRALSPDAVPVSWTAPDCDRFARRGAPQTAPTTHLSVPLIGGQRVLGLLNAVPDPDRLFAEEEISVISALGNQGASALERAQLYATLEHKVAERTLQLQSSREHLALAQKIGNIGSSEVDMRTGKGRWTEQAYRIHGLEPADKPIDFEFVMSRTHPEDRAFHRKHSVVSSKGLDLEARDYRIVRPDGEIRWIRRKAEVTAREENGAPKTVIVTHQDLTDIKKAESDRRALEAQLTQSQKMEAVGNLTGGIAHDFNNMLAVVIGNLDLLKLEIKSGSDAEELVDTAIGACLRGSELTKSLLAFSRRQPLQPKLVSIDRLLQDSVKMLSRAIGEQVDVQLTLGGDVWSVLIDPSQLESAVLNMMVNARDAMPNGGRIIIQTRNTSLDQSYADQHAEVTPGDYVVLEVSDTGHGMSPEILAKVFEPFFTTKEKGKGTGLGLSMVFGFVKQSGGHIKIYSEVGHGTTIRLYLPRAEADGISAASNDSSVRAPSTGHNESVLVVEDNPSVRRIVAKQLTNAGYRVAEAETGAAAVQYLEGNPAIDLVFSDVVMPGSVTGADLGRVIARLWPTIKVLLTSGFPEGLLAGESKLPDGINLLSKPYRTEELLRKLRELLDG